jgi:hypothetical protein
MQMIENSYPYLEKKHGISRHTLYSRVMRGMTKDEACAKPARRVVLSKADKIKLELKGINPLTVKNRIYIEHMSVDEAKTKPIRKYERFVFEDVKRLADEGYRLFAISLLLNKTEANVCAYCKKHGIKYKKV